MGKVLILVQAGKPASTISIQTKRVLYALAIAG
jgi:hypothetical protein